MTDIGQAFGVSMDMRAAAVLTVTVIAAYLIGNISPAILIGKMAGLDIRSEGSGNAGTTNVLRVLGKKAAAGTLAIDILKGVAAVLLGRFLGNYFMLPGDWLAMICAAAVFIGHIWPAIFGFRGGKGIATGFGAVVTLQPLIGVLLAVIALLLIAVSRRVSVGSVLAAASLPFLAHFIAPQYTAGLSVMALIAIYKHRANIARIFKGEEPKISLKK